MMLSIPHKPSLSLLLAVLSLLALPATTFSFPDQKPGEPKNETSRHEMLFGLALEGLPDLRRLRSLQEELGVGLDIVNVYLQWPATPDDTQTGGFPTKTAYAAAAIGARLCITWEPMFILGAEEHAVPAGDILAGKWDPYISGFAAKVKAWGAPVILRFAHEMNLARYHWGGRKEAYGPESPERYRKMFRYVAAKFSAADAGNCMFAFCPNAESIPDAAWNMAKFYYPGDDVAHIVGMDGYNWGTTQTPANHGWQSQWRSFEEIFADMRRQLRELAPHKPLFVFETASVTEGGDKELWLSEALATARRWNLAGLVWFNADKETDWILLRGITVKNLEQLR